LEADRIDGNSRRRYSVIWVPAFAGMSGAVTRNPD
jgi:hypothetical protein